MTDTQKYCIVINITPYNTVSITKTVVVQLSWEREGEGVTHRHMHTYTHTHVRNYTHLLSTLVLLPHLKNLSTFADTEERPAASFDLLVLWPLPTADSPCGCCCCTEPSEDSLLACMVVSECWSCFVLPSVNCWKGKKCM